MPCFCKEGLYSYFAETEREYIALRTKQGLEAARAKGKILGRPKGSKNRKGRALDNYYSKILDLLNAGASLSSVAKIINTELQKPVSYATYKFFVIGNQQLLQAWKYSKLSKGNQYLK